MGGSASSGSSEPVAGALPRDIASLPPFFQDIFVEVLRHKTQLGGIRNFGGLPQIGGKIKAEEFKRGYTDFEYIYLTVLGLARLHVHAEEIIGRCNGKVYTQNPGVQLLEVTCGMTMHGDRPGAVALLRGAPASLLEAFQFAKRNRKGTLPFFKDAFDRTADPCLEGRMGRIYEFIERHTLAGVGGAHSAPPWEDVSLKPLAEGASVDVVVGEHLRVFMNECTWQWSQEKHISYEDAKSARFEEPQATEFATLFNAATFAAMLRERGAVGDGSEAGGVAQWEVQTDVSWSPLEPTVNEQIERGRLSGRPKVECRLGPKAWRYEIDLRNMVQRNPKTGKERPLRCVKAPLGPPARRKLLPQELNEAIRVFVDDLVTLPAAPPATMASASSSAPAKPA